MRETVDLQAVTDRVLGFLPPRVGSRARRRKPNDRRLAVAMLLLSAMATVISLGLWLGGHGVAALQVFCGSILVLVVLLRTR